MYTDTVKGLMRLLGRSFDWTDLLKIFQLRRFLQKYNQAVTWFLAKVQPRGFLE